MKNYPQDADASVQNKNKTGSEGDSAAAPFLQGVTLGQLQQAHVERQEEWCPDQKPDLSFRGNEMAGEVGEACNVIKKLERERQGWRGSRATKQQLADELADVVHTAILCAITAGIDLAPAVVEKFNSTSEKNGLSTTLSATEPSPRAQALEEAAKIADELEELTKLRYASPDGEECQIVPLVVLIDAAAAIRALSSQPVADHIADAGKMVADGCKGEWREIEYNHALKGRRVNPAYFPSTGEICEISGPNCDDDKGYTWSKTTVLWQNEMFVVYGKTGCWPVLHKHEHVLFRPLPASPGASECCRDCDGYNCDDGCAFPVIPSARDLALEEAARLVENKRHIFHSRENTAASIRALSSHDHSLSSGRSK